MNLFLQAGWNWITSNEKYDLDFPENESETLSGYIINRHETIPRLKEHIIIDDYEFEILSVSDTRIEMVKMKLLNNPVFIILQKRFLRKFISIYLCDSFIKGKPVKYGF